MNVFKKIEKEYIRVNGEKILICYNAEESQTSWRTGWGVTSLFYYKNGGKVWDPFFQKWIQRGLKIGKFRIFMKLIFKINKEEKN